MKDQFNKKAGGEDDLEFDDPDSPDREEAIPDDDVQLPPNFLSGKADKLRRKSTAISMKFKTRLERIRSSGK